MASLCKRAAVWLAVLLHAYSVQAASSFWTYTSRYQMSTSYDFYTNTYLSYVRTYPYSYTRTIESTITPTVTAYSTSTAAGLYAVSNLDLVYEWYTAGAVAESDLLPDTIHGSALATIGRSRYTVYSMAVTMTPPATCASQFTFSTTVYVTVPTEVQYQMKPTSVRTSSSWVTAYLTDGAAPYSLEDDFTYTEYILSCSNPTAGRSISTGRPSSGNNDNSNSYGYSYCYYNCNVLKTWVIVIAVVLPTLFLLGFIESWFWFRRLMTGRGAMRFGTISWIGISLWVACFTRFQSARSQNDQKLLREKWKAMSAGTAFKLWWKWGFKHRYPTELLGEYSRNDSGVPSATGDAVAPMAFTGGFNGPPPPGPPPGPPPFINHNGVIYIPQTQQSPHAPPATSYLDYGGIIYVPQVMSYAPSTISSNTFAPSPPPQTYPVPQGYNSFYDPQKEAHVATSHSPGPPTEISSITHSPPNQHAQPAPSEVSGVSGQVAAQHGQVVYTPPVEVEGNRPENVSEWIPPNAN